jgi:hypothetical protein
MHFTYSTVIHEIDGTNPFDRHTQTFKTLCLSATGISSHTNKCLKKMTTSIMWYLSDRCRFGAFSKPPPSRRQDGTFKMPPRRLGVRVIYCNHAPSARCSVQAQTGRFSLNLKFQVFRVNRLRVNQLGPRGARGGPPAVQVHCSQSRRPVPAGPVPY